MLAVSLGSLVGLALSLTGGGGSIFAIPLLLHGLGASFGEAVAISALAVGSASLVGAVRGFQSGLLDARSGTMFALTGVIAAPFGVHLGHAVTDSVRLSAFAGLLFAIGLSAWRKARSPEASVVRASILAASPEMTGPACRYSSDGKLRLTAPCAAVLCAAGTLTGLLSGMFGVGGGFLIVPALRATTGLSLHRAVATSLFVIVLISAATTLATWVGTQVDARLALPFIGGSIVGMVGGTLVAKRLAGPALQRTFAVLVVAMGVALLVQSAA